MICQNCLEDADCCICRMIVKATLAVEQLKSEWLDTIGSPMPDRVAVLEIEKIKIALEMAKNGAVFGELPSVKPTNDSSLMDWDRQDDKNGNAYA